MGGSLGKKALLIVVIGFSLAATALIVWYLTLPQAMTRESFRGALDKAIADDFASIEFTSDEVKRKLAQVTAELGSIRESRNISLHNPRFTYPTLQASAIIDRDRATCQESYTFVLGHKGELVLVGFSTEPNRR
ncbi:MAG: hypothetical protein AMXMBFR19_17080 [Chthonomonadaceae bacterium]